MMSTDKKIIAGSTKKVADGIWLHHCNRCENQWTSPNETPKTCANTSCRSPYWNKKRVKKSYL